MTVVWQSLKLRSMNTKESYIILLIALATHPRNKYLGRQENIISNCKIRTSMYFASPIFQYHYFQHLCTPVFLSAKLPQNFSEPGILMLLKMNCTWAIKFTKKFVAAMNINISN